MAQKVIPLYFCSFDNTDRFRRSMAKVCLERWKLEHVEIRMVTPVVGTSGAVFQRERRQGPKEKIYILADDDCLLSRNFSLSHALATLAGYPDFACLSLLPTNATINEWTPEGYEPKNDSEVMEHVSVGGIRFQRYVEHEWPVVAGPGYDMTEAECCRKVGYRVGYFRKQKMLHLGEGYSTVWR